MWLKIRPRNRCDVAHAAASDQVAVAAMLDHIMENANGTGLPAARRLLEHGAKPNGRPGALHTPLQRFCASVTRDVDADSILALVVYKATFAPLSRCAMRVAAVRAGNCAIC